jgi:hypothetical protein
LLKKLLMVFGFASVLAFAAAFAADKASAGAAGDPPAKEAQKAALQVESKAPDCGRARGHCPRKKSGAAQAQPSEDQNVASSGIDCPKSADCPKADCDRSMCPKSHGKAEAGPKTGNEACDKPGAETEI